MKREKENKRSRGFATSDQLTKLQQYLQMLSFVSQSLGLSIYLSRVVYMKARAGHQMWS